MGNLYIENEIYNYITKKLFATLQILSGFLFVYQTIGLLDRNMIPCFVAGLECFIFLVLYQIFFESAGKYMKYIQGLYIIIPLIMMLLPELRIQWIYIWNECAMTFAEKGIYLPHPNTVKIVNDLRILCCVQVTMWFTVLFSEIFRWKKIVAFVLINLLPCILFFRCEFTPKGWILVLMFIWIICYFAKYFLTAGCLVAFVCIMALVSELVGHSFSTNIEKKSILQSTWDNVRYRIKNNVLPDGDLEKASSCERSDKIALEIGMSQLKSYYLKGYVGSIYMDNGWINDYDYLHYRQTGILSEDESVLSWLGNGNFYSQSLLSEVVKSNQQDSLLQTAKKSYEAKNGDTIDNILFAVKNVGAQRKYLYLPYECETSMKTFLQSHDAVIDAGENVLATGLFGNSNYQFKSFAPFSEWKSLWEYQDPENQSEYFDLEENIYKEYVYRTFLTLPNNVKETIYQTPNLPSNTSDQVKTKNVVKLVKRWLKNNISYKEACGKIPENEDFATWFFLDEKKGYDVHYASAAVLLFRYYGIPARYVEGYVVSPDLLENGKTNTTDFEGTTIYKVEVPEKNAHAWAEIYIDDLGWIPIEVTPEYQDKMSGSYVAEKKQKNAVMTEDELDDVEETHRDETLESPNTEGDNSRLNQLLEGSSSQKVEETDDFVNGRHVLEGTNYLLIALGALIVLAILCLVAYFIYHFIKVSRRKKSDEEWISSEDRSICVSMWYRKLELILSILMFSKIKQEEKERRRSERKKQHKHSDIHQNKKIVENLSKDDNRTRSMVEKLKYFHEGVAEETLKQSVAIRQKNLYSPEAITEEEKNVAVTFFSSEIEYLESLLSKKERFFYDEMSVQ